MKKLLVMFFFLSMSVLMIAQSPFKTVPRFATVDEKSKLLKLDKDTVFQKSKWAWRFDATMVVVEVNRNKVTKEWTSSSFSAIGPAIGVQKFVPKSDLDPTPVNVYGASLGVALGSTVYNPQLGEAKVLLAINLWEYFKFGVTYSINPTPDMSKVSAFFGGGITF